MTLLPLLSAVAVGGYLVGAIPFGLLVARLKGVDILNAGSGNIGATNVWRVCGWRYGLAVFLLDFVKGGLPVLAAYFLPPPTDVTLLPDTLPVLAGVSAFVGHLFPVYLGFRGGKGVATGAGVIAVLLPVLTVVVLATWAVVLKLTRYVSIASIVAPLLLVVLRFVLYHPALSAEHVVVTGFCLVGTGLVLVRHAGNVKRLIAGTEHRV